MADSNPITEWIPEQEVRESGLLAHINRTSLWYAGAALTAFWDKDTGEYQPYLRIRKIVPMDAISEAPEGEWGPQDAFTKWLRKRMHEGVAVEDDACPAAMGLASDNELLRQALTYALNQWSAIADPIRKQDGYGPIADPVTDDGDEESKRFHDCMELL